MLELQEAYSTNTAVMFKKKHYFEKCLLSLAYLTQCCIFVLQKSTA